MNGLIYMKHERSIYGVHTHDDQSPECPELPSKSSGRSGRLEGELVCHVILQSERIFAFVQQIDVTRSESDAFPRGRLNENLVRSTSHTLPLYPLHSRDQSQTSPGQRDLVVSCTHGATYNTSSSQTSGPSHLREEAGSSALSHLVTTFPHQVGFVTVQRRLLGITVVR